MNRDTESNEEELPSTSKPEWPNIYCQMPITLSELTPSDRLIYNEMTCICDIIVTAFQTSSVREDSINDVKKIQL